MFSLYLRHCPLRTRCWLLLLKKVTRRHLRQMPPVKPAIVCGYIASYSCSMLWPFPLSPLTKTGLLPPFLESEHHPTTIVLWNPEYMQASFFLLRLPPTWGKYSVLSRPFSGEIFGQNPLQEVRAWLFLLYTRCTDALVDGFWCVATHGKIFLLPRNSRSGVPLLLSRRGLVRLSL